MQALKASSLFLFFTLFFSSLQAQEKYSKVKIYGPANVQERAQLIGLLQIDHFYAEDGAIISEISEKDILQLKKTKYRFEILVDDVAKYLEEQNREYFANASRNSGNEQSRVALEQVGQGLNTIIDKPAAFTVQTTFGGYYSLAQMNAAMDALVATYPAIAQKILLGSTVENRQIWAIKISDNVTADEEGEPEVLYTGLQHAREAITGSSLIFFMQYLCEKYTTDVKIKALVDNREFYIVPCVNPDGWERNRRTNPNGGGGQRKNRLKNTGADSASAGVDLNRNYGIDWGNCVGTTSSCGSSNPIDETYYGKAAFSELETQAIKNLVTSHHFVASIDQHSYGPYYSLPFGRPSLHTMEPLDKKFYTAVPALMGTYNGMRAGNSPESVGYEVAGGIKDWLLMGDMGTGTKGKVYGMTGEGGAGGGTTGTYGSFWAPAAQIINLCKGMVYQNLQLAYAAGSYVSLQDVNDIATTATAGSFQFKLTRIGLGNEPVTVSLLPMENIQTAGSPVVIDSLPNYYDTITKAVGYTLPAGLTSGQRLRFAWKIETGGYTYFDTVTKFYNPTQLLYDNMEGTFGTNWTSTSNLTTAAGNWGFVTNTAFSGAKSMTESPGANYTASTSRIATYRNTLDLSNATAVYLSFWVKYRAENFRDKLQVQVSTNGKTWVAVAGSTTVQEPGLLDGSTINGQPSLTGIKEDWTREIFDLSAYKGNTALRLRFAFTSDANTTGFVNQVDDGFYIDEVKVIKSSTALINLANNLNATLVAAKAVQLSWEAIEEEKKDYIQVEYSTDDVHFTFLDNVNPRAPYNYIDNAAGAGNNYYRIKKTDAAGKVYYGKSINIIINDALTLGVYPNPVTDWLTVTYNSSQSNTVLKIIDLQGRQVYTKKNAGYTVNQKIDVNNWKPQVYILKVVNEKNEVISLQKFIKQ